MRGRAVGAPCSTTLEAGWHEPQRGGHGHIGSGVYFARRLAEGGLEGEGRIFIAQ